MGVNIDDLYKIAGAPDENQDVSDWLSTGYLPLNKAISGKYSGGLPVGRITEIFGGESSGKTMIATMAMIETQKKGGLAVMLDYEHAFSLKRAITLGLDPNPKKWFYKQPLIAEEGLAHIENISKFVKKEYPDIPVTFVCDSVASMLTQEMFEGGMDALSMKAKLSLAALMSEKLPLLAQIINKTNVTMIFLNQVRVKPGVIYGDKEDTKGGVSLKFFASVRIKLIKFGKETDDDKNVIGEHTKCVVIKNKVSEPYREAEYITHFTEGVNLELSHIDALDKMGLLGDSKGWLVLPSGEKFRKKDLVVKCKEDREFYSGLLALFND